MAGACLTGVMLVWLLTGRFVTAPPALVSMLAGGWLADAIGVEAVFVGGGFLGLVACLAVAMRSPAMRGSIGTSPASARARP